MPHCAEADPLKSAHGVQRISALPLVANFLDELVRPFRWYSPCLQFTCHGLHQSYLLRAPIARPFQYMH
jgi:hypothetical protein